MKLGPVMVDVQGLSLTANEIARLRHPLVGGVILFARNFASRAQLCELTAAIRAVRSPALLIAVDHEGGRVQRFKADGFTTLPAMRRLGARWEQDPMAASKAATAVGYILASELRACGVDFSFTPVLDLDYGVSGVIGDRAFHRDPQIVTALSKHLNYGLALAGMRNCGKHFPGHGFVNADSHLELPVDTRTLDEILAVDAAPYDWLGSPALSSVMPAHVVYSQVDSQPAGFSRYWLQTVLRERFRFDGVIFSDDLSMEGAKVAGNVVQRAQAAFHAGCDMVLVCNAPDAADELLAGLRYEAADPSLTRLARLHPTAPAPTWDALLAQPDYQSAQAVLQSLV